MFDACTKTLPSKSKFWKFYTNLLASPEFGIIKKVIIITKFSIILQTQAKMQRGGKDESATLFIPRPRPVRQDDSLSGSLIGTQDDPHHLPTPPQLPPTATQTTHTRYQDVTPVPFRLSV